MPTYEALCSCGAEAEYIRPVSGALDTPDCAFCGSKMEKIIRTAPTGYVRGNFEAFKSVVDGTIISGQKDLDEHNKRNNVVSLADGYSDDVVKAGSFGRKKVAETREVKSDLVEAYKMTREGYKPQTEVLYE